ncbi:MAG TPA: flagellar motor protein MotB [Nocardioidaceae bacterium]|nr:flagellar motor protein MotB [Nocardioidaceae bacterium]
MPRARRRGHAEEEHVSHERWLITYADMITLLMVLFIVLFAVSQVDQKRFEALKDGMAAGFGQTSSPFQGSSSVMPEAGIQPLAPIRPAAAEGSAGQGGPQSPQPMTPQTPAQERRQDQQLTQQVQSQEQALADAESEVARLEELRRRIAEALRSKGYLRDVSMAIDERGLTISLVSRHIVFAANLAELTRRGGDVLDAMAPVMRDLPEQVEVDGHTNQVKVHPKYYPTDWDLSAARAVTVLRYLNEQGGIDGSRLSAVAFGHERPLIDPAKPHSQALNKRVDIVIRSDAPEQTRQLFDEVLGDRGKIAADAVRTAP